jgi:beta-glucosidase
VARAGLATVFPQAIGLAATWDRRLMRRTAAAISDEARAKYHDAVRRGNRGRYFGLTYWSPNINIFRDPRWGRGHETYGEDPYLTGEMGAEFVRGLQGTDRRYLKVVATPKHYAVHSGPEGERHRFDAVVSRKEMEQTYLPAFARCVGAGAYSVMGAYNRTNGEACCASPTLLRDILRGAWGFKGYVVSDCGAIADIYRDHKIRRTAEEAAALAVRNGCDLNCGGTYAMLVAAVKKGLVSEEEIDTAVKRLFTARMRLGMFDPDAACRYARIPMSVVACPRHRRLALQAARESIVLLKNSGGILPLSPGALKTVAVIGPNANEVESLVANYCGAPSRPVTPLEGIMNHLPKSTRVLYSKGCEIGRSLMDTYWEAVTITRQSDVALVFLGLSPQFEGEEGCTVDAELSGDRRAIELLGPQLKLLKAVHATGTPVVLVLLGGSAIAAAWAQDNVPAIVEAWYPGEEGGCAIADVLFGRYNPAGRLPVTFYRSTDDLPPFGRYSMAGRTYRYLRKRPLYPFGFGLSYTRFVYGKPRCPKQSVRAGDDVWVNVRVRNAGPRAGDEVVQVYVRPRGTRGGPLCELKQFARVRIAKGRTRKLTFVLRPAAFSVVTAQGRRIVRPGWYDVLVGGCSPSDIGRPLGRVAVRLTGMALEVESSFRRGR